MIKIILYIYIIIKHLKSIIYLYRKSLEIVIYSYNPIMQIQRLNLSEEDFEYEHQRQMLRRKAADQAALSSTANRTD